MSSSVLELLEESSDELPRISDLEDNDEPEAPSSDTNKQDEIIVLSSDDEAIEISSEEQLPSSSTFETTPNNNRKPKRLKYLRVAISRPCKKLVENVNDTLEQVESIYRFTTYYQPKNPVLKSETLENMIDGQKVTDAKNESTNSEKDNKKTSQIKEIQRLLERKVP